MFFKKITSTLLLMTILLQSVLPTFAMEEASPVLAEEKAKKSPPHAVYKSSESIQSFDISEVTYVDHIEGGSGGVSVLRTREGDLFTLKSVGDLDHMKEEILADALLQALGVNVPHFAVYNDFPAFPGIKGGPGLYRLSRFIVKSENASEEAVRAQMQRFFVANAFLSNFDIVVGEFKNIVFDREGTLWQVDNGGSLRFRATGGSKFELKEWDPDHVRELETMRDPAYNSEGAQIYKDLQEKDILEQIKEILDRSALLLSTFDHVASALHLESPSEVREMLRRRLDDLFQRYSTKKTLELAGNSHSLDGFIASAFASGIFVCSRNDENEPVVLLGKRAGHHWWCNPGGTINAGENSREGAVRETQEESLGHLSFTPLDLSHMSSHAMVNSSSVFYRMYIAPHPFREAKQFMWSPLAAKYNWELEYTEFRWVSLSTFLDGLKLKNLVTEENTETCQIEDMILYPPFWEMLKEDEVRNIIQKILEKGERAVSHPYNQHTHNEALKRIFSEVLYLPLQNQEMALAETVVRKHTVLASLKKERKGSEVSETIKTIKSMSGYLSVEKTAEVKAKLRACPYTQTEAYLKWIMNEDFEQGGNSQQQIEKFLRKYAKLTTIRTPKLPFDELSPFDQHYVTVLTQALEAEKKHSDKAVFYHASDPMTCFLWNIFTVYRSRLELRGGDNIIVLRALDDKFSSILDVEAFIKSYQNEGGGVDNYATVGSVHYADLGLSVNPGLPGNDGHSSSATYHLFYNTQSIGPTQQEALFNYFMSTLGIPGEFKNYEALFNQYYSEDLRNNALLLQIFIDPQVLDSVSYMALAGGTPLTLGGTAHPDHRFGSYLSELRTNPDAFNESLKIQGIENLNRVQGRLFLKPEIFHNPEFVKIHPYWHHPMKSETDYWDKLNRQITQDLTEWLLQHTYLRRDVFFEGVCPLKRMYQLAYEDVLNLPYRERSFKSLLSNAIRGGNMTLIGQIFEKHPEIDLNEGVPSLDYRSSLTPSIVSPFNLLSSDTSSFSEVVQFLIQKKVKRPLEFSINCEDKLLNEFLGAQDRLQEDLLSWTTASLERNFNFSDGLSEKEEKHLLTRIVEWHQNEYKQLFSFMRGKIEKFLRAHFLEEEEKIKKVEKEKGIFAELFFFPKMINMIEVFLVLRDAINIPELSSFCDKIVEGPNDYFQQLCASGSELIFSLLRSTKAPIIGLYNVYDLTEIKEKSDKLIEALASNTNLKTLKISHFYPSTQFLKNLLTDPRFASLETLSFEARYSPEILETMLDGLKGNTTLKELKLHDNRMMDVMINLMSSPQGPFTKAAWFIKTRAQVHQNPENYFKEAFRRAGSSFALGLLQEEAFRRANFSFALGLLQETSCPIKLSTFLTSVCDYSFLDMLIDSIQKNTAPHSIDLSDISFSSTNSFSHLSEALATNTTVQFLDLTSRFFDSRKGKILALGLQKNNTLQKISLNEEERVALMSELMKMEGPFRSSPWFIQAWEEIISAPVKSIKIARDQGNPEIIFPMIAETPSESLDLSAITPWPNEWIHFAMRGLIENKTIQALTLDLNGFRNPANMNYLTEALCHTKPLVTLALKGISELCSDASSFIKGSCLFDTLKMSTTISVLDLDFSSHLSRYSPSPLDALIPFLEKTNIRTIVFRDYYFSPSQAQLLTKSCLENSSLKTLDLSKCFLAYQQAREQETMMVLETAKKEALAIEKTFLIPAIAGAGG
ncbi:MAG: hypothetical protein B7Y25_00895 [Alphaproteobacteria bacterium 16-39-46]|nr:MAG: hypothetical protein B7Y25_00895 [Alphaproteobacteria bacterium 16-39-46]OZA44283.1 MAG: hypothetical protein B7X84_00905 [Alphaproteobacteria bacterium 17-39-52]HQS83488.1 NUDIX hydrolase [Alphaproteobacteria bacterium]HQS93213.1 NUDIX hydrolase [Alphaproteobacteria bacterium]